MTTVKNYERLLLTQFVESFAKLDEMDVFNDIEPINAELLFGDPDEYGRRRWRPLEVATEREALEEVYRELPAKFPRLFELLALSYRWAEVDLRTFTLLANPPGPGLEAIVRRDPHMWKFLLKRGYIQFAKGPDCDYDPVCFAIQSRTSNGRDYKIVKIDHEEILCFDRLKIVQELAPSFEELVKTTIRSAGLEVPPR